MLLFSRRCSFVDWISGFCLRRANVAFCECNIIFSASEISSWLHQRHEIDSKRAISSFSPRFWKLLLRDWRWFRCRLFRDSLFCGFCHFPFRSHSKNSFVRIENRNTNWLCVCHGLTRTSRDLSSFWMLFMSANRSVKATARKLNFFRAEMNIDFLVEAHTASHALIVFLSPQSCMALIRARTHFLATRIMSFDHKICKMSEIWGAIFVYSFLLPARKLLFLSLSLFV